MTEKFEEPIEIEQTPEQIREILDKAKKENLPIDLILDGNSGDTTNMLIDNIENDVVYVTYIYEDGGFGELLPLDISRIESVKISYRAYN
jgi:hypothetical protein